MDRTLELVRLVRPVVEPPKAAVEERQLLAFMQSIGDPRSGRTPSRSARRSRKDRRRPFKSILVAAALLVLGGSVAAAVSVATSSPDEQDVAKIEAQLPNVGADNPNARPVLNAEMVFCDYHPLDPDAINAQTFASEFPLGDVLELRTLIDECTRGNDAVRDAPLTNAPYVFCTTSQFGDAYPTAAVVFGARTCEGAGYDAVPSGFLADINRRRTIEAAILAVPGSCPSKAQAISWARKQVATSGEHLRVRDITAGTGKGQRCYLPEVEWALGEVWVDAHMSAT